jgi:pimeloyl-ACP methyl ester carboxylesterase
MSVILHTDDRGSGPITVVLLHGFPFNRSMWGAQVAALEGTYRVVTPDLRGHGASGDPGGSSYGVDAMADDVLETLAVRGIEGPVVLGGLSMGGYVALSIASRAPGSLQGLMLLDTKATADTPEAAATRLELAQAMESTGNLDLVVRAMLPKLLSPTTRERNPELAGRVEAMMRGTKARSIAATSRGLADRPDRMANLPGITAPTLVLVGADDAVTPPDASQAMAAALPNATLAVIPDAGHLAPMEQPEAVNAAIQNFLRVCPIRDSERGIRTD